MKNKYELKRHFLWPVDRSVALCFVSFLFIFFIRFYSGRRLRSWEERQVSSGVGDGARTISFFFFFFPFGSLFRRGSSSFLQRPPDEVGGGQVPPRVRKRPS